MIGGGWSDDESKGVIFSGSLIMIIHVKSYTMFVLGNNFYWRLGREYLSHCCLFGNKRECHRWSQGQQCCTCCDPRWILFLWQIILKDFLSSSVKDQRNAQFFTPWSAFFYKIAYSEILDQNPKKLLYLFEIVT